MAAAMFLVALTAATTPAAATPEAALKAYFNAGAKGDGETMKKLSTGEALKDTPKPGSRDFTIMMKISAAFKSVSDVKIAGNQATAVVYFETKKMYDLMMEIGRRKLATIKDPAQRAKAVEFMKAKKLELARKIYKLQARLVKTGAGWLVAGLK